MAFVVRYCAVILAAASPLWAREPTSQDYDVWAAILTAGPGRAVYVWHRVDPTTVFDRGRTKYAFSFFPEARPVAKAWATFPASLDADKLRFAQQRSNRRSSFMGTIKLLDRRTLARATGKPLKPAWLVSPKLFADADAIYKLSWPAYREDGRAAFLICAVCTEWWGSIIEYQVDKHPVDGSWRLGRTARIDYTHWKNAELVNEESG